MKIGYIGKNEINAIKKNKPFTVHPKETKAKNIAIYAREELTVSLENAIMVANTTGMSDRLKLSDAPILKAYTETILRMDRQ